MTLKNIHKRVRIPLTKQVRWLENLLVKVVRSTYDNRETLNQLTLNLA